MDSFSDFYKSLDRNYIDVENQIISGLVRQGIITKSFRYDIINGYVSGVVKSTTGELYHVQYLNGNLSVNKGMTPTQKADLLDKFCFTERGCDLVVKGDPEGGGGGTPSAGVASVEEDQDIQQQQEDLITERHPGSSIGMTPDRPDRGRQWHAEQTPVMTMKSLDAASLLSDLNETIRKSVKPLGDSERQFMIEVVGKSREEVDSGLVVLTPQQKVAHRQWLNKSMRSKLNSLSDWLQKSRG